MRNSLLLNGKFLSGPNTGVQRVAAEMIKAIDRTLAAPSAAQASPQVEMIMPNNDAPTLQLDHISTIRQGYFKGIPWEQLDLPRLSKGRLIINLANLGPVLAPNAITMIHDAQTFSTPDSYSRGFRAWYGFIQPMLGRRNRCIVTVSEFSRQQLVHYGIARAEKIFVIHNGVDHMAEIVADGGLVDRAGLRSKAYFVGLANVQPHKNINVLLRAFDDAALSSIDLVLFGSATPAQLELAYGKKLPSNIRVLGKITDGELRGLLENAQGLVFPSKTEGFGLPPLEAMYVGCPVIVAPRGALPEVCGDAAIYADADDHTDWISKILFLTQSPERRAEAIRKGSAHVQKFTWDAAAAKLLDVARAYW